MYLLKCANDGIILQARSKWPGRVGSQRFTGEVLYLWLERRSGCLGTLLEDIDDESIDDESTDLGMMSLTGSFERLRAPARD